MDANIADMRSSALAQSAARIAQWEQDWYARKAEIVVAGGGTVSGTNDVNDWAVHWDATWEQAKRYPVEVGEYLLGYFIMGPWGMIKGTYFLVRHPIQSAQGLYYAARHPVEAFHTIKQDVVDQWNSGNVGRGALIFDGVMTVLPAAKAGQVSKVRLVAKTRRLAGRIEDAAPKTVDPGHLVLGKGTPSQLADVAEKVGGVVINRPGLTGTKASKYIRGRIRGAERITQVMDGIPTSQPIPGGRGTGEFARFEKIFIDESDELLKKTRRVLRSELNLE